VLPDVHIAERLTESSLHHRLGWVKSHQDQQKPYKDLDMKGRMNVDADALAETFRLKMESGAEKTVTEGALVEAIEVALLINGKRIPSHYAHKIQSCVQGKKHRKYLQEKHEWNDETWNSLDLQALKSAFLTLDPLKRISCSKRIHGWLNTGEQKSKISPTAPEAHCCPRCKEPLETQEHVLTCKHVSAHKRRYELLPTMKRKIQSTDGCKVQEIFVKCVEAWLANSETQILPDISTVPIQQQELLRIALSEQDCIGWTLGVRGYISRHWAEAVAAHSRYENKSKSKLRDIGNTWARKTVSLLWEFSKEMWEDRNKRLHDPSSEDCRKMKGAAVDAEMHRLYDNIDSYAAEDRWRFDLPLALRLKKPLRSRRRWLELTKILVEKSTNMDTSGQQQLTTYFQRLETERHQQEVDAEVRVSESHPTPSRSWQQLNLFSIFGWRPMDP